MSAKNEISLYCNWNLYIDTDGSVWLPSVHAQYIKALKNIGFNKITLTSKVCTKKTEEHDYHFKKNEIEIISIAYFSSYLTAFTKLPSIIRAFYKQARKKTNYCYIRTYEPFIWLLVLFQKVFSRKTKLYMHYISDPKSAIFSNATSSKLKKVLRYAVFLPEYYLTNISSIFCNVSSNGPVPIKNTPFFVRERIKEVIESALLDSDINQAIALESRFNSTKSTSSPIDILYVGYIRPSKGINILVDAVKLLADENIKNFKVTIIGSGEYITTIKKIISEHALESYFTFKGYIPFSNNLFQNYISTDVFINLSPSETGPRVLLEAGIFNCYLISTKVGYSKRIVNENNGILIDINDSLQAKNAIRESIRVIEEYRFHKKNMNIYSELSCYTTENFFKNVLQLN
ncbi:TPA: glycosyltransferase [Escherichia coli]